ncbi:unnamed protein product, partial [Heterotrigona itama]
HFCGQTALPYFTGLIDLHIHSKHLLRIASQRFNASQTEQSGDMLEW